MEPQKFQFSRILLIIFFVGLFSLDVFGTGAPALEVLVGFLLHNMPSIVMLVLLIAAWKQPLWDLSPSSSPVCSMPIGSGSKRRVPLLLL